jgi:diguanylate cyclase (GGDEF)-like protein
MEKKHILLVEDSPTQARFTSMILEKGGYRVSVAGTGEDAVEMAQSGNPDLILLDVVLPDMDGFDVCRLVRRKVLSYIPILMFTQQRTAVEDQVDGLLVGADDYLSKPIDPRVLQARVGSLLRVKQIVDELEERLQDETQSYQALKRIALTDHLTGLYNRHFFSEVMEREFNLSQRYSSPLACIMLDLDFFHNFNTQYGHPVGDHMLQEVARILQENMRSSDIVARYGGEEFVAVLPLTGLAEAGLVAERVRYLIAENRFDFGGFSEVKMTASLGVSFCPSAAVISAQDLLSCADKALYQAKANGRNRVENFT